jgi:hypothetical protein
MSIVGPDFVSWVTQRVAEWSDRYAVKPHRAFPAWALHFLFDVDDDDAFNQTDTLTQGDAGLDGWYYDRDGNEFHLIQAKFLSDPIEGKVSSGDLDPLIQAALLLRNPSNIENGPQSSKLTSIALELEQAALDEVSISLDFIVFGRLPDQSRLQLEQSIAELGPQKYSANFYDTERLWDQHLDEEPISDLKGQSFSFDIAGPKEFFERDDNYIPGVLKVAVVALDGRSLANVADKAGAKLFQRNVRYYLSKANKVNKSMRKTLETPEGRHAFWLYNNGITIVADSFYFSEPGKISSVTIENPQIVNGAQTTSVLRDRRANVQPGDVAIQARIIAVSGDEQGREALERISEYTNSQSPVRAADLHSNDLRHRKIQANFDMLTPPVFYERRRGEWQSLDPASQQRYKTGKVIRRVTKEKIGQRMLAFRGKPAESVAKKDSIFTDLGTESEAFDPTVSAHVYMLADVLYNQADDLMKNSQLDRLLNLVPALKSPTSAEEGAPTQLEALRPARGLVLAYAVAMAHEVLQTRYGNIGPHRAEILRDRLSVVDSDTSRTVWRAVFQAISMWLIQLPDKSALKKILQRNETYAQQTRPALLNSMGFIDLDKLLPAIPHSD